MAGLTPDMMKGSLWQRGPLETLAMADANRPLEHTRFEAVALIPSHRPA